MKKILQFLTCITILGGSANSVIACNNKVKNTITDSKEIQNYQNKKYWSRLNNSDLIINNDFSKLNLKQAQRLVHQKANSYSMSDQTEVLKSTLAGKILDTKNEI